MFGILGVSLFKGDQYYRCRLTSEPMSNGTWPIDMTQVRICNPDGDIMYSCNKGTYCGNPETFNLPVSFAESQNDDLTFYGY